MNKDDYNKDLQKRQQEHLDNIKNSPDNWQPCLHDSCSECVGTGKKRDGSICVHMISCSCPKCSPTCM